MALFNSTPHLVYSDPGFTGDDFGLAWGQVGSDNVLLVSPAFTIFSDPPVFLTFSDGQLHPKIILFSDWIAPTNQGFEIFDIDNDGENEVLRNYFIDLPSDKIRVFKYNESSDLLFLFSDITKNVPILGADISAVRHNNQSYLFEATRYLSDDFTTTTAFVSIFLLSDYSAVLQSDMLIADMLNLSGIAVRDIDNDGQLEMALADQTKIKFFKNTSDIFTWSDLNCDIFFPNSDGFPESLTFAQLVASDQWDLVVTTSIGDAPAEIVVYRQAAINTSSDCDLSVNAGSDQIVCAGTLVTLGLGSAEPNVTYQWSPQTGIISPNQFPTTAFVCSDTTYTVVASRTNVSDCFASDSITFTTSDCGCGCQQASTIFSQPCKNCPTVALSIKHKTVGSTLDEFFSSDGNQINIKDNCFISSYTPIKKNIGLNKSYGSDLGFGYVCYTYSNGLTVVRQENGDIILVNNGDINIDSPIDLSHAFHFGDWISSDNPVSSDKMQPNLIIMSNKGSININQNVTVPGLVTCMAPNGHVHVTSDRTLQSTKDRVVIMASDSNRGSGTITPVIPNSIPSNSTLSLAISDGFAGPGVTNTPTTLRIVTSDNVIITNNAALTKNLEIITPGSVTTSNITSPGKNISITAGHIHTSDIDTSSTSSDANADGGNITLISQKEIVCRDLLANGDGNSSAADGTSSGEDGNPGNRNADGGSITLISGTEITSRNIQANGGGLGSDGVGGSSGLGGNGGNGGTHADGGCISLIAGTSITTHTLSAVGGGDGGLGGPGGLSLTDDNGNGGQGGAGGENGDGGTITLVAGTFITTDQILSNGNSVGGGGAGAGDTEDGGDGGVGGADADGGTITLIAGTSITATLISTTGGGAGGTGGEGDDDDGTDGIDGINGDGGTITLIACGNISVASVSVATGPGSGSAPGKGLIKSYGTISDITSGPNIQVLKMRDLRLSLPNKIAAPSGSDINFNLTILNQGFGIEPAGKIAISAISNSNNTFGSLPDSDILFPSLLPGQSDQISVNILKLKAGKFEYILSASDRCLQSKTLNLNVSGQSTSLKTTVELSGSYVLFDLLLPSDFIGTFGTPSDHKKLCSDMHTYLEGGPQTVGFNLREQSDFILEESEKKEEKTVRPQSAKAKDGSILITVPGENGFSFAISDCTSDSLIIDYSDALNYFKNKKMQVIGFEALVVTFEQKETNLGIVSVLPSDQSIKFSDTASFSIVVQNTGPADVSDAFIKITSNLGETFSDKLIGFLPSDGTLVSDTITLTPTIAGSHMFSFEIDSTLVINTNGATNTFSDVHLDVCQLEIASTNAGPIIALPNLPFVVPFDLTKTGGNSTAHITAKISDVAYYQSDFAAGSHTIIIDAPGAFVDNTIVKLTASDGACYDDDHHVIQIQVIDSLSDAASLLGTTVSDIKQAIDSNQIMQVIEDFLGRSDLIPPGFPSNLIDRLWDTPIFKEILPLLLGRSGGIFDAGSLIHLILFGSFVNMTVIPNPTLMLYLVLNLIPLPTSDPVSILETICNGLSTHSDIPNTATIHISGYSDFFLSDALILNGDLAVNLSCSDNKFFFAASDEAFLLSLLPFNASPYQLCYSDNTQQICKQFNNKIGSFDVVLVSDNTFVPPPPTPASPKSHLDTLFKALLFAIVGGGAVLIALKNKD